MSSPTPQTADMQSVAKERSGSPSQTDDLDPEGHLRIGMIPLTRIKYTETQRYCFLTGPRAETVFREPQSSGFSQRAEGPSRLNFQRWAS